jgi:Ca2+-binding RTX toxin-like protein
MSALTATPIVQSGVAASPAAVAATDTIAESQFGSTGVILRVINGGASSDNVTVADPGTTPMGNGASAAPVAVANGATTTILVPRAAIDPATGYATVTHSYTTSVTYELYRI